MSGQSRNRIGSPTLPESVHLGSPSLPLPQRSSDRCGVLSGSQVSGPAKDCKTGCSSAASHTSASVAPLRHSRSRNHTELTGGLLSLGAKALPPEGDQTAPQFLTCNPSNESTTSDARSRRALVGGLSFPHRLCVAPSAPLGTACPYMCGLAQDCLRESFPEFTRFNGGISAGNSYRQQCQNLGQQRLATAYHQSVFRHQLSRLSNSRRKYCSS